MAFPLLQLRSSCRVLATFRSTGFPFHSFCAGILYPAAEDGGDEAQEELVTDAVFRGFLCFSFFFQKNSCIFVAS